jgi:hypothetical protein
MSQFGNPAVFVEDVFVGQKWLDLSEILRDYNPQLELKWIPPDKREPEDRDKPYAVVHRDMFGKEYVVTYGSELENPEEVLTRVFYNDMKHGNVQDRLNARNTAHKAMELYRQAEEMEEAKDLSKFMMGSPKNWIKIRDKSTGELRSYDSNRNNLGTGKSIL